MIPELQAIMEIADPEWQSLIRFGLYTGRRLKALERRKIVYQSKIDGNYMFCPHISKKMAIRNQTSSTHGT